MVCSCHGRRQVATSKVGLEKLKKVTASFCFQLREARARIKQLEEEGNVTQLLLDARERNRHLAKENASLLQEVKSLKASLEHSSQWQAQLEQELSNEMTLRHAIESYLPKDVQGEASLRGNNTNPSTAIPNPSPEACKQTNTTTARCNSSKVTDSSTTHRPVVAVPILPNGVPSPPVSTFLPYQRELSLGNTTNPSTALANPSREGCSRTNTTHHSLNSSSNANSTPNSNYIPFLSKVAAPSPNVVATHQQHHIGTGTAQYTAYSILAPVNNNILPPATVFAVPNGRANLA